MNSFEFKKKSLPGGLRTILLPRQESQTVTLLVLIGTGSRYETAKEAGLSHFLEHMFFKGTTKRPTTKEIAEVIDNIGGEFNAFTGEEYTGYYVKVAAQHLATGADMVADILQNPLFPDEEIKKERGVIIEEIRMYTDAPMRHIHHLWQEALYGKHPLGQRIDGSAETVSAIKRNDFLRYTKKHYHSSNALVVLAGKFDEDEAMAELKKLFVSLPSGKETHPKKAPAKIPHERFVSEERNNLDQTHMIIGVPGVGLNDERRYAAQLLSIILGGGMSSRLFLSVREEHGLAYAVHTGLEGYVDTGSLATQLGVRSDKADVALELVMDEYDRVMTEEVSAAELKKAKEMIKGHLLLDLEETNALAQFVAGQELLKKKIMTPQQLVNKYNKVTAKEILSLSKDLFATKKRTVAVLAPKKVIQSVKKAFQD
jgi:predicted Zn-dependent peptidase